MQFKSQIWKNILIFIQCKYCHLKVHTYLETDLFSWNAVWYVFKEIGSILFSWFQILHYYVNFHLPTTFRKNLKQLIPHVQYQTCEKMTSFSYFKIQKLLSPVKDLLQSLLYNRVRSEWQCTNTDVTLSSKIILLTSSFKNKEMSHNLSIGKYCCWIWSSSSSSVLQRVSQNTVFILHRHIYSYINRNIIFLHRKT